MINNNEDILLSEDSNSRDVLFGIMIHFYSHMMKYTGNPIKRTTSWIETIHNGYVVLKSASKNDINYVNANIATLIKKAFAEYKKEKNVEPDIALNMVKTYFPECDYKINEFNNGLKIKQFLLDKTNSYNYTRSWPTKEELLECIESFNWN